MRLWTIKGDCANAISLNRGAWRGILSLSLVDMT